MLDSKALLRAGADDGGSRVCLARPLPLMMPFLPGTNARRQRGNIAAPPRMFPRRARVLREPCRPAGATRPHEMRDTCGRSVSHTSASRRCRLSPAASPPIVATTARPEVKVDVAREAAVEQGLVNTTADITLDTIVGEVTQRREEFDRLCHVPRDMIERMIAAGIFRSSVPRRFGGNAVPPHEFLPIVERISEADGSAGWVAGFGSASVYLAALPVETQAVIYDGGPDQVFGGGLYLCSRR